MIVSCTEKKASCERIIITTANNKTYDLGSPDSKFFNFRVFIYKVKRWLNG
jgi:hypothetical protein